MKSFLAMPFVATLLALSLLQEVVARFAEMCGLYDAARDSIENLYREVSK